MKIENNTTRFTDPNNTFTGHKRVVLTSHLDVHKAINEGVLTVDGVSLELSDEAREKIKEADEERFKKQEEINEYNMAMQNLHSAKQQGEAMAETFDNQARALEIARRISEGGHVPYQDEKLLLDYSEKLYQMAKQAAMLAKEHEKYDTLVPEKEPSEETDPNEGTIKEINRVQVDINAGEATTVEATVVTEKIE